METSKVTLLTAYAKWTIKYILEKRIISSKWDVGFMVKV